jgi:hypothetical protein
LACGVVNIGNYLCDAAKLEMFAEYSGNFEDFGEREVFNRISKALEVSPDCLLNGTIQDKAKNNIKHNVLIFFFKKIEKLPENKKHLVKEFLDAFILKSNLQQQLS